MRLLRLKTLVCLSGMWWALRSALSAFWAVCLPFLSRVSYTTQSGSEHDRINTRYNRVYALVFSGKPKWQRWATFNRLEDHLDRADAQASYSLMLFVQKLTGKKLTDWLNFIESKFKGTGTIE